MPGLRVLITRPREDAEALADVLRIRGVESAIAPMLSIEPEAGADLDLDGVQAVLLTSANGARALARATPERGLRIFAVGDATARIARSLKFYRVESAGGTVEDLARLVIGRLDPRGGALLHAAGQHVAGDLAGLLVRAGFTLRRVVLYRARAATEMPATAVAALSAGTVDAVLFFSPRTAATFVTLARGAGLETHCARVAAVCLSPAVARAVEALPWRSVLVADRPEQSRLLGLIDRIAADGRT